MNSSTIEKLLSHRGARFKGTSGNTAEAYRRAELSRTIAHDYMAFEHLRDMVLHMVAAHALDEQEVISEHPDMAPLLLELERFGLIQEQNSVKVKIDSRARRYLSGGWLEELAWLAAKEAGADEAVFSQILAWEYESYHGENEIDLIMRKGHRLALVSCKALKSELDVNDRKLRNKLMDAVYETDSLVDHFGRQGDRVALVVSTGLHDELRNVPRYQALLGKAAVLNVHMIPLEEIVWDKLVHAMHGLLV